VNPAPLNLCFHLLSGESIGSGYSYAKSEIETVFNTVAESHEIQISGSKRFKFREVRQN
jgi:hypothetical protein